MLNNRCSGYNSWNHLILLYAPVIQKVIWLHLAQVAYLPQRVTMIWCSSWIKRAVALYVTGCGQGLLREWDRCWHNIRIMSNAPRCASGPQTCPNSGPGRTWSFSRRLALSAFHIFLIGPTKCLRKAHIGWPVTLDVTDRYQTFISDVAHSEQALQMSLDPSTEVGPREFGLMKAGNKSKELSTW